MNEDETFFVKVSYGRVRIEQTQRFEGGRAVMGSRVTTYGGGGKVLSVAESDGCSMGWDDGSPMTAIDYAKLTEFA